MCLADRGFYFQIQNSKFEFDLEFINLNYQERKSADPFIIIFDVGQNTSVKLPAKHRRDIGAMCFSPDGNMLASNGVTTSSG